MPPLRFSTFPHAATLGCLAALTLTGCDKPKAPAMPPAVVSVMTVQPESAPVVQEYIGRAKSPYDVELGAQISGVIKEKVMKDGAAVKAGDLLFIIDDIPYKAALDSAAARLAQAEAAEKNAASTLGRVKALVAGKAVSDKDLDDAVNTHLAAQAQTAAARADMQKARWALDNTRIKAPVAGTLGKSDFAAGAPVTAQGAPLVRLQQFDPIWVTFTIPENTVLNFRKDVAEGRITGADRGTARAQLLLTDGTVHPNAGVLDFADVNVRDDIAALEARAVFPNADRRLMPGQFFRVRLSGPKRDGVFLVPQRAVQINPADRSVHVAVADPKLGERIERRVVRTGDWIGDKWVIESGLKAGDRVVVEGVQRIGPGAPVLVKPYAPAAEPAPATPEAAAR